MDPTTGGRAPFASTRTAPLRVGVIGCGLIAQVMHLPYLRELSDRFSLEAICDLSPSVLAAVGERFAVPKRVTRWQELLELPLDAVLIATPGIARPARDRGRAGRSSRVCREADVLLAGRRAGDDRGGA